MVVMSILHLIRDQKVRSSKRTGRPDRRNILSGFSMAYKNTSTKDFLLYNRKKYVIVDDSDKVTRERVRSEEERMRWNFSIAVQETRQRR